jgi:hypothetical protein
MRSALDDTEGLLIENGRAFYRPTGAVSFDQCVALVRAVIDEACNCGARELLVDTTELTGFESPTEFHRFLAALNWAEAARGRLHLAMVARPEMIHPERVGVSVAAEHGLVSNIFPTHSGARAWLDGLTGQWWR